MVLAVAFCLSSEIFGNLDKNTSTSKLVWRENQQNGKRTMERRTGTPNLSGAGAGACTGDTHGKCRDKLDPIRSFMFVAQVFPSHLT